MDWLVMDWLGHGLAWSWTGGRGLAVMAAGHGLVGLAQWPGG
ncbi:MAG TPA: hypothetical protein VFI48_03315 [Hyphomicrobiaceae bacterium]|nr:hypothetical protein [Hyphomicrobiaceae bacterium]